MNGYRTIRETDDSVETLYEIQKSRFITHIRHVETEEEARAFIQAMKKQYFDARHNCSAYVLGERADKQKSNDDGEPGGTAGNPILEAIKKNALTDVVIVVTRYFGGIKLGAGGLIRAYGHRARHRSGHAHRDDALYRAPCDNRLRPPGDSRALDPAAGDPHRGGRLR